MRDLLDQVSTTATRASSVAGSVFSESAAAAAAAASRIASPLPHPTPSDNDELSADDTASAELANTAASDNVQSLPEVQTDLEKEPQEEEEEPMEVVDSEEDTSDEESSEGDETGGHKGLEFSWTAIEPATPRPSVHELIQLEFSRPFVEGSQAEDCNESAISFEFAQPLDVSVVDEHEAEQEQEQEAETSCDMATVEAVQVAEGTVSKQQEREDGLELRLTESPEQKEPSEPVASQVEEEDQVDIRDQIEAQSGITGSVTTLAPSYTVVETTLLAESQITVTSETSVVKIDELDGKMSVDVVDMSDAEVVPEGNSANSEAGMKFTEEVASSDVSCAVENVSADINDSGSGKECQAKEKIVEHETLSVEVDSSAATAKDQSLTEHRLSEDQSKPEDKSADSATETVTENSVLKSQLPIANVKKSQLDSLETPSTPRTRRATREESLRKSADTLTSSETEKTALPIEDLAEETEKLVQDASAENLIMTGTGSHPVGTPVKRSSRIKTATPTSASTRSKREQQRKRDESHSTVVVEQAVNITGQSTPVRRSTRSHSSATPTTSAPSSQQVEDPANEVAINQSVETLPATENTVTPVKRGGRGRRSDTPVVKSSARVGRLSRSGGLTLSAAPATPSDAEAVVKARIDKSLTQQAEEGHLLAASQLQPLHVTPTSSPSRAVRSSKNSPAAAVPVKAFTNINASTLDEAVAATITLTPRRGKSRRSRSPREESAAVTASVRKGRNSSKLLEVVAAAAVTTGMSVSGRRSRNSSMAAMEETSQSTPQVRVLHIRLVPYCN
jgi:hypothetical protein